MDFLSDNVVSFLLGFVFPGFHGHVGVCRPLVNGCFVVSDVLKANCSEDHGHESRSDTHGSVEDEIILRVDTHPGHELFDLLGGFDPGIRSEQRGPFQPF